MAIDRNKVNIFVSDSTKELAAFPSGTLTKLFSDVTLIGKRLNFDILEPNAQRTKFGEYTVRDFGVAPPATAVPKDLSKVNIFVSDATKELAAFSVDELTTLFTDPSLFDKRVNFDILQFNGQRIKFGEYTIKGNAPHVCADPNAIWNEQLQKCVCKQGYHDENGICVKDPTPVGEVLYDSLRDSNLHDGVVATFEQIGSISPGGNGLECRASGNPRIRKNADNTFSLLCDSGHGRFYGYTLNYNATLEIEAAFWNSVSGQDLSLKMRSQHNEDIDDPDRNNNGFGGYGLAIDRSGWGAKREPFHNEHDQSTSGSLPSKPETQKYFKLEFTVKDESGKVRQIGKYNGTQFMSKLDSSPESYMVDQTSFGKQSYYWVRQNVDSGTGEIRIKRLRILKA